MISHKVNSCTLTLKFIKEMIKDKNPALFDKNQAFISTYNTTAGAWDFIEAAAQLLTQKWSGYWDSFLHDVEEAYDEFMKEHYSNLRIPRFQDLELQES